MSSIRGCDLTTPGKHHEIGLQETTCIVRVGRVSADRLMELQQRPHLIEGYCGLANSTWNLIMMIGTNMALC